MPKHIVRRGTSGASKNLANRQVRDLMSSNVKNVNRRCGVVRFVAENNLAAIGRPVRIQLLVRILRHELPRISAIG